MQGLKIAVIGGGSSYTPEIIEGLILRHRELPVSEIWLVDVPAGQEKLSIIHGLARRMIARAGLNIRVEATLDRKAALQGARFVLTQFRVGGLAARARDERFPLKYNVIGQETTGPGGFAKALRTIPVMLEICREIEKRCPNAWLINFTNPSGLITEAVRRYTRVQCIGLCNVPINMVIMAAKLLNADKKDITIDFVGLNHLVWGKRVLHKGLDVTKRILDLMADSQALTMNNIPDLAWDGEFLAALGLVPSPYQRYYYMADRILAEELAAAAPGGAGTRAEQVQAVESRLFEMYRDEALAEKPKELEKRGGAYYSEAAVSLISAIYNDKQEVHTVNTLNQGVIAGLPDDCVIEVNAVVGRTGARPLPVGAVPWSIAGLITQVKAYELLAVEAGVTGDKAKALLALANHPLVPSAGVAQKLLTDLLAINADFLPQFREVEPQC